MLADVLPVNPAMVDRSLTMTKQNRLFVIVILGLPGTGKTTLARTLSKLLGCVVLTTEEIRISLFPDCEVDKDNDFTPQELELTYRAVYLLTEVLLSSGANVIINGVFRTNEQRRHVIGLAHKYGAGFAIIQTTCADSVALSRIRNRSKIGSTSAGGETTYYQIKREFEPLEWSFIKVDTN